MELYKLQYFVSVARHLSFTRAAEECFISQTVISRQIANLEEELGVKLFYRNNREVELTPAGEYFFDESVAILQNFQAASNHAKQISVGYEGSLKIGIGPYEPELLKKGYCQFAKSYPGITISTLQFSYRILAFRFTRGLLDFAICPANHLYKLGPCISYTLCNPSWMAVAHKDHEYWSLTSYQQQHLTGQTLLLLEDDYSEQLKISLHEMNIDITEFQQTNFLTSLLLMAEAKSGVCVLPSFLLNTLPETLRANTLEAFPLASSFVIAFNESNHNPCIQTYLDLYQSMTPSNLF